MKIAKAYPPNIAEIAAALPAANNPATIFCYGDTIYVPGGGRITAALHAHESVHSARQGSTDEQIRAWWSRYITDVQFRLDEELPAHRAEYEEFCRTERGHGRRIAFLDVTARRLSGPLYGGLIDFDTAKQSIRTKARDAGPTMAFVLNAGAVSKGGA